jgi:hypothetical protein
MADEAFALSPIAARAALPTDADYEAILEAFMETSRGRWFLTEYAKRNRNADTRMVLEAVERIEATLAGQKQTPAGPPPEPQPAIDLWPELSKALTRTRIEIAQRLVRESSEEAFEAIRSSAETIKSVSWALRERGFDTRICDFFDVQVNAITDGYTGLLAESSVANETEADVLAAFDALIAQVEALTQGDGSGTEALDAVVDAVADAMAEEGDTPSAYVDDNAAVEAPPQQAAATTVEPAAVPEVPDSYAGFREIYGDDSDIEIVDAAPVEEPPLPPAPPTEPEINRQRLFEAKFKHNPSPAPQAPAQGMPTADDIEFVDAASVDPRPSPAAARSISEKVATLPAAAPPSPQPPQEKSASLGQALLESGLIKSPRPDPLTPFRRMSQVEKVAFFT